MLPSLKSLLAFESAVRHGSFSKAASELNVTQSAISHQIKSLEDYFDIRLASGGRHTMSMQGVSKEVGMLRRDLP